MDDAACRSEAARGRRYVMAACSCVISDLHRRARRYLVQGLLIVRYRRLSHLTNTNSRDLLLFVKCGQQTSYSEVDAAPQKVKPSRVREVPK
jgi:hypothetical protein